MRVFIAVDIPDDIKKPILELQKEIKKFINYKEVEKENLHITLKFLGEINEKQFEYIKNNLEKINYRKFECSLIGVGAFPSINYPRVIWVGVGEGKDHFKNLFNYIESFSSVIRKEGKKYEPHLTIGRVKYTLDKENWLKFWNRNKNKFFGKFLVDKIKIKKSILMYKGPIYEDLYVKELS